MKNELISIIVPIFNTDKYLTRCIESILKQTYINFELLLINDGSTDKSKEVCEKYLYDKRIKLYNNFNQGVSKTRNFGINVAKGKFIIFIDSDDYIEKNMIKELYNIASKNKSDIAICSYNIITNKDINIISNTREIKIYDKNTAEKMFFLHQYPFDENYIWAKLFRRELFKKVKFREDIYLMEDSLILVDLIEECKNKIVFLDKPLYNYIKRNDSASNKFNRKSITSYIVVEELLKHANSIGKEYRNKFLDIYSKTLLNLLQKIVFYDFNKYKKEFFVISESLNNKYSENLINECITFKNKVHLSILKINPKLYRMVLQNRYNPKRGIKNN